MIVDEMITGFGRTGKYWGQWHSGVEADIVTLGKQFGGGFPMSAVMSGDEIVNALKGVPPNRDEADTKAPAARPPVANTTDAAKALLEKCMRRPRAT